MQMNYPNVVFSFLGSLGLFLFGMTVLSRALQKTAGCQMKRLLGRMSKNRFRGVLFGAGVTAVIQSSTATTVMAVGFVNAGIISLTQTVGIIMGANIGSTTTSWLVSSVEWAAFLKPDVLGAVCAAGGALLLLFSKKEGIKNVGEVIVGFGVLFIGLSQMPAAVKPLAELDAVRGLFLTLGQNPALALLAGIAVTGVIQSSTASIGILQSMAVTGMIPWNAAVFIVLGQNVGTCFTTMLTSIGANKNTRAASFVHFVYNAAGAVVFSLAAFAYFAFINPAFGETAASSTNVSMIHTGYNVLLLLLLFPMGGLILKAAVKMAGGEENAEADKYNLAELDESILETPVYALENTEKAIQRLMGRLRGNLALAAQIFNEKAYEREGDYRTQAGEIEQTNAAIRAYLTRLYNEKLGEGENLRTVSLMHNLTGLERINNHTKGIVKQSLALRDGELKYAPEAAEALRHISGEMLRCYDEAVRAFTTSSPEHAALAALKAEEIQALREAYKTGHMERVSGGQYDVQSGIIFMEVVRHFTRIAGHAKTLAETD
jgi:phosphate:Na+ symporter